MGFKSDKQRKGFFANNSSRVVSRPRLVGGPSSLTNKQKRKILILKPNGDYDKDGVKNSKDCRPFDPKKQGLLHDLAIKSLKKKEEWAERKRERQMQKLEDLKDELRVRNSIIQGRNKIEAQKLAIKKETLRERKNFQELKKANQEAKKELFRTSKFGQFVSGTARAGRVSANVLQKTSKALSKALK